MTEFAACANRYQPLAASGLGVVVCDQDLLKDVYFGDREDAPVADLEPVAGERQEKDPLVVDGLDPADPPAIRPLVPSRALHVYAVVNPPSSSLSGVPMAVLFPPVAVSLSTRLHVAVPELGPWTLTDGRIACSPAPPRAASTS